MRPAINRVLKKYNGKGLPRRYQLEADPLNGIFDVFVAGYFGLIQILMAK